MAREDLNLIGQRYATSKCHTLSDLVDGLCYLGYRGEALASTIDVSGTIEISSRHHLSQQTYSKIFFHGRARDITLSSNQRPSVGTTITVHDFFYNLPVRRKALSAVLEMENVRQTLQGIALANPSISFSLRNDLVGECVLRTRKTNSILSSFSMLFGPSKAGSMKEVSLKLGVFAVSGYVSTESHHNKLLQFIYVNGRLVKKTPLHSCVNNAIANSLIARGLSRQSAANSKWRSSNEADIGTPRKISEKHGMYVLMLRCPRTEYDICLEPAKTLIEFKEWEAVLDCLLQVVRDFLTKHSLTLGPECAEDEDLPPGGNFDLEGEESAVLKSSSRSCEVSGDDNTEQTDICTIERGALNPRNEEILNCSVTELRTGTDVEEEIVPPPPSIQTSSAALLHLNRPVRSPLNCCSISSKLASILKNAEDHKAKSNPLQQHQSCTSSVVCLSSECPSQNPFSHALESRHFPSQSQIVDSVSGLSDSTVSRHPLLATSLPSLMQAHPVLETTESAPSVVVPAWDTPPPALPVSQTPFLPSLGSNASTAGSDHTIMQEKMGATDTSTDLQAPYDWSAPMPGSLPMPSSLPDCLDCQISATASDSGSVDDDAWNNTMHLTDDEVSCIVERTETGFIIRPSAEVLQICSADTMATTEQTHPVSLPESASPKSMWKEKIDPRTAKKVYIHSKTGNCRTSKPEEHSYHPQEDPMATTGGTDLSAPSAEAGDEEATSSTSYGAKPIAAAPHLSFAFQHFLPPSAKRLRLFDNSVASSSDLSEVCASSAMAGGEATGSGGEEGEMNFQNLFRSWKNPVFLPGQEVYKW